MSDHILYEEDPPFVRVTINRPEAMNALLHEMVDEIESRFLEFEKDTNLTVAILTAAGDRAFCAGGDLKSSIPETADAGLAATITDPSRRFFSTVTKPVIAAVNGFCLAGGMEVLLGTDLRIAAQHATFGLPEVRWGLMAAGGAHTRLPRELPWVRSMELLLLGGTIDADVALSWGLVNRVVEPDQLQDAAMAMAKRLSQNGPFALRMIKQAAQKTYGLPIEDAFRVEFEYGCEVFDTEDAKEGPLAFAEKRTPKFTGS